MGSDLNVNNDRSNDLLHTSLSSRADYPCPSDAVIAPCTCTLGFNNSTFIDCTFVESIDQLVSVFQQDFPVRTLYEFIMANNSAITVLSSFMNGITFETVNLSPGPFSFQQISENFLLDLKDTLKLLYVFDSKLTTDLFPFSALPSMNQLEEIRISTSDITSIPAIRGPKLKHFSLVNSSVEIFVSGTFSIGTGPMSIVVDENQINTIEVGSIFFADQNSADSNQLVHIDGYSNRLQTLQAGVFPMRNGQMIVHLPSNIISTIEPGAFVLPSSTDLLTLNIDLHQNKLSTFDEAVFGSLMPFTIFLTLTDNPLTCGCDIAWLILNENYLNRVDNGTTCADGTYVYDLDPQQFIDNC